MLAALSQEAYDAARREVAYVDRSDRGRVVVSGPDRATYLQGLLTNDIVALEAGSGCYAAYLTAQGRMIADLLLGRDGPGRAVWSQPKLRMPPEPFRWLVARGLLATFERLDARIDAELRRSP